MSTKKTAEVTRLDVPRFLAWVVSFSLGVKVLMVALKGAMETLEGVAEVLKTHGDDQ